MKGQAIWKAGQCFIRKAFNSKQQMLKKAPGCMQPGLIGELLVLFYIFVG
jgi:hypothetical protein